MIAGFGETGLTGEDGRFSAMEAGASGGFGAVIDAVSAGRGVVSAWRWMARSRLQVAARVPMIKARSASSDRIAAPRCTIDLDFPVRESCSSSMRAGILIRSCDPAVLRTGGQVTDTIEFRPS